MRLNLCFPNLTPFGGQTSRFRLVPLQPRQRIPPHPDIGLHRNRTLQPTNTDATPTHPQMKHEDTDASRLSYPRFGSFCPYRVSQRPNPIDCGFDNISAFEERCTGERCHTFRCPSRNNITRFQRHACRHVFNQVINCEDHLTRLRVLLDLTVHAERDLQVMRVRNLVLRHEPRSEWEG